ncbi:MAG: 6-phosphogluconolactonase [Xanthobacteraceae bacterium]
MTNGRQIIRVNDADAIAQAATERLIARLDANSGRAAVCLTGGSSPERLYRLLASDACRDRIPWRRVHWFIGDERFVPPDDPRNNMAMARRLFLDVCAPPENVHPIPVQAGTTRNAARRYETMLQTFYGSGRLDPARPLFDLVLMGVGPDGHTASLFPDDPALDERTRWVVGVAHANVAPFVPRVTLTLPTLASCREMLFEVSGEEKLTILAEVLNGSDLPAARARSLGETVWLVDSDALPELSRNA